MAYDVTKLSRVADLKSLAQKIVDNYATQSDLSALQTTVNGLVSTGGEPNVIETVQLNGTALTVTNKTVNVAVPTAVSELTNDSGYQTASDVATAVAAIVADAPEAYDTLKEISDWISSHTSDASSMNSAISDNADAIAALQTLIGTIPTTATSTTIVAYISEVSAAVEAQLDNYVEKEDGKGLSSNDFTDTYMNKLIGLSNYTHPDYDAYASNLYKITVDSLGHVSAAVAVTASDIEALGVAITDTTYGVATTTSNGLMSASDKAKLDGMEITTDAEVTEMLTEVFGA